MEWKTLPKDIKIIVLFSAVFTVVALGFFSSRYLFSEAQQDPKTYTFQETVTISTTTTTQRTIAPLICRQVAMRNDCKNLEKFSLTSQECCQYSYCCDEHEFT